MKSVKFTAIALAAILSAVAIPALAQVMVGGAPMYSNKDIVDNAVNSKDHTTLVAAVKAAGLVPTLKGAGPFTVFAPTNAAFAALPAGTVDTLLKPENKPALTKVLTYHVVAGKMDSAALIEGDRRRRRQGDADRGLGRHAHRDPERQHDHAERRVGRHGPRHDPRRRPVERRHPRRRQGPAAEVDRPGAEAARARFGVPFLLVRSVANAAGTRQRAASPRASRA